MCVKGNIEARPCNYCSGKAVSITQSECMFVALGIQRAMCLCHVVIRGLPPSKIFFHIISKKDKIYEKKKLLNTKCVF